MQEIITERPNLFEPNDYITFYLELSGKIHADALADAVKTAYEAKRNCTYKGKCKTDWRFCKQLHHNGIFRSGQEQPRSWHSFKCA